MFETTHLIALVQDAFVSPDSNRNNGAIVQYLLFVTYLFHFVPFRSLIYPAHVSSFVPI